MKKKIFIFCIFALLISFWLKMLERRTQKLNPIGIQFVRQNGSHVNARTIFKKPGQ